MVSGLLAGLAVVVGWPVQRHYLTRRYARTTSDREAVWAWARTLHGVPIALAFGFSATWWKFATDANAYVPSIFLLLCAYILLERPGTTALAGLAQAGAMLFHELAFLFLLVAFVRLRKSRRSLSVYAATAVIPVAAAYLAGYIAASDHATVTGLGIVPRFRYEKYRTEFADDSHSGHVVIDETPIGNIGEIEGPADWIDQVARKLGIAESDYITLSYATMFYAWRERTGSRASDMTWAAIGPQR